VNLSVLNLLDLGIAHDVARLLGERGVPPHGLKLEVTEEALMFDAARSTAVLGGLHAMGVALAVDDLAGLLLALLAPAPPARRDQDRPLLHPSDRGEPP
jgi:EAL domain-containing protein (putative c-di-GMP-specific phosphodiesterase class I)